MNPDRFTIKTQEALQAGQRLAEERRNPQLTPEHLLAVLLEQDSGVVVPVLEKLGADPAALRARVNEALDGLPTLAAEGAEQPNASSELMRSCAPPSARPGALQGRVHLHRAPAARAVRGQDGRRGDALREAGGGHDALAQAVADVRGPHRVPTRIPRTSTRRCRSSAATSPNWRSRESSTR